MVSIPLLGGAYVARSPIANAQRCVNLFPEKNPEDSEVPVTHFQAPGLLRLASGPTPTVWRGLYFATNLVLYGVLGDEVFRINDDWTLVSLGKIASTARTPVSMVDNGQYIILVDGSTNGWTIELANDALAQLVSPNFLGGDFVQYIDTFFILNQPGTRNFYSSESNSITFQPLDVAAKTGFADKLVSLIVTSSNIWLLGQRTGEIWSNVGAAGFPFQRVPGVFVQHGCAAKYSVAQYDVHLFWLSQDNNGQALVLHGSDYRVDNVTTPAMSFEFSKYEQISDAIGFVYQQGTHVFYVLTFPTENKTWVYDLSTQMWHQRTHTDQNGGENRIRANCTAFAYSKNVVGDFQNGRLYALDEKIYTDDGTPIVFRRGFPHISAQGKTFHHRQFIANISVGTIVADKGQPTLPPWNSGPNPPAKMPMVSLRWSDTRGVSWGEAVQIPLGATGEYISVPTWTDLGQARDRVYELFWAEDCEVALNGAYLDLIPLDI